MAKYALGIKPLIVKLGEETVTAKCKQAWYADDSSSAGELLELKKWWDVLQIEGPKYGYFPLPTKSVLIVKEKYKQKAKEIFGNCGVKITTTGERHMGAVVGTEEFKIQYVNEKVAKWVQDVEELTKIAEDEPQSALSSFTKAISHRWTYVQRTIPNISNLFQPLEEAIRTKFIPAIVGRAVSDIERQMLALPVRLGGIGIRDPTTTADLEYLISATVTNTLADVIVSQDKDFSNYDSAKVLQEIQRMKTLKEDFLKEELQSLLEVLNEKQKRCIELAQEKGAGSWLTALPLKAYGYTLNKQEFRDSICLRYDWKIPHVATFCHCGKKNDIDHALSCKRGGYVIMRHDRIRNLEAEFLREVCTDVRVEPQLLPLVNLELNGTNADKARLDTSSVGLFTPMEKNFTDVQVTHLNCPSNIHRDSSQVYASLERKKKSKYNERIINVEKGSFTPLVMSTTGGMGVEATRFHKRLALLISEKRKENYAHVMNHIRTRLRFCLLKSTVMAIRGIRGKRAKDGEIDLSEISYNLI